jgi:hypothetical protein
MDDLPWPKPEAPSKQCSAAIERTCTKDLHASRGLSGGARMALCLALSSTVVGFLYWLAQRADRSELGLRTGLYGALGWGAVQAAVLFAGLARPPGARGSCALRFALALLLPVAFLCYLAFDAWSFVPFAEFAHGARAEHAFHCGLVSLFVGATVSAGVLLAFRGTDPLTPRLSGALAGLVGGLGGALAMGIACPSHEAWHLWFAHGLVVVALGFFGFAVGRRILAP